MTVAAALETSPLARPVTTLYGVGPEGAAQLARLEIRTIEELFGGTCRNMVTAFRQIITKQASTWRTNNQPKGTGGWTSYLNMDTWEPRGMYNFYKQLLIGDTVDNIQGVPKIGDKTADKILSACETEAEMFDAVQEAYYLGYYRYGNFNRVDEFLASIDDIFLEHAKLIWIRRDPTSKLRRYSMSNKSYVPTETKGYETWATVDVTTDSKLPSFIAIDKQFNSNKLRYEYVIQLRPDCSLRFTNEDDNQTILIGDIEIPLKVLERVAK